MPQSKERSQKGWHGLLLRAEARLVEHSQAQYIPSETPGEPGEALETYPDEVEMQKEELRRTQAQMELLRDKYRELYEHAPTGYLTLDRKGFILDTNLAAAALLGEERARLKKRRFGTFVHIDDRPAFSRHLALVLDTERKHVAQLRLRARGGNSIFIALESVPVRDREGGTTKIQLTISDVTELKRAEEVLEVRVRERTAELERSNRELQDFASIASHDLRDPLRKIRAFLDLLVLKSSSSLNEQSLDYVSRIEKSATRMQMLLTSLLGYSRVTANATPFKTVDLNKTVEVALSNLEITIKTEGAIVEVGRLPNIEGDRVQMVQLFQNLIGNALKYHREGEGPVVRIYSRPVAEGPVAEGSAGERVAYDIFVEDAGIGFDEKFLDRILAPFQRLHGRDQFDGVGMGLAICKKIVERHGGSITAKSAPGKGSTFMVRLPANQT